MSFPFSPNMSKAYGRVQSYLFDMTSDTRQTNNDTKWKVQCPAVFYG